MAANEATSAPARRPHPVAAIANTTHATTRFMTTTVDHGPARFGLSVMLV